MPTYSHEASARARACCRNSFAETDHRIDAFFYQARTISGAWRKSSFPHEVWECELRLMGRKHLCLIDLSQR